jgi:hypothetical protein
MDAPRVGKWFRVSARAALRMIQAVQQMKTELSTRNNAGELNDFRVAELLLVHPRLKMDSVKTDCHIQW